MCPAGQGVTAVGSATSDRQCADCQLGAGYSASTDGVACTPVSPQCVAGKFEAAAASTSSDRTCTDCISGSFTASAGLGVCSPWRTCPASFGLETAGSVTTDRVCAACVLGTSYSAVDGANACSPVSEPCAAGTFTSAIATASSDRVCTECPSGTFAATAGLSTCTTWRTCSIGTGMSVVGTAAVDRQCTKCLRGRHSQMPTTVPHAVLRLSVAAPSSVPQLPP